MRKALYENDRKKINIFPLIEQKGMIVDHDFGFSFPLFSLKKGKNKRRMKRKIVVKSMPFCSIISTKTFLVFISVLQDDITDFDICTKTTFNLYYDCLSSTVCKSNH